MIIKKVYIIICQIPTLTEFLTGQLGLEIIHDFLEFFKLDYTLSVFNHESNLKDPKREGLAKKLGINKPDTTKPLLFSIINSVLNGEQLSVPKSNENRETLKLPSSTLNNTKEEPKQGLFGSSNSTSAAGFKSSNIITNFGEKDFEKKGILVFINNKLTQIIR